jgi:hypothetical protein
MLKIIKYIFAYGELRKTRDLMKEFVTVKCPSGKELKKCIFKDFRNLPIKEQIEFRLKKKKEFDNLFDEHMKCLCKRNKIKL